ncbi:amidohydrolase [Pseudomonas profundi]|uniref:amidohydrolase n=1 Tax=Pseudomonas profundi TaxID=1981513 RepID=UPI00123B6371|nr:amidohydrolase [Pseudomonas profundi]
MIPHRLLPLSASLFLAASIFAGHAQAAPEEVLTDIRNRTDAVEQQLITWRRDIHQHPELGGQETRTAALVAEHLRELGMEVQTEVGRTGVVGILKGGQPGPTVALRADMDALPIEEPDGLPFASQATGTYFGDETPVMHACGHDAHTAMLMAAAEVLTEMKDDLPGTVMFIFQPAEEGSSLVRPGEGKSWGAELMLEEGLFKDHKPEAIFAVHVMPGKAGSLSWRTGASLASSDMLEINVNGKQGHGGMPWNTVDPIVASAQVIMGLQPVVSRKANLTKSPAVVTIGSVHGGSGPNIVPERVEMTGTIRTYDEDVRAQVGRDIKTSAEKIAESAGATAEVSIIPMYPPTVNDADLVEMMAPVLEQVAESGTSQAPLQGAAEDFAFYAQEVPGFYFFLGVTPPDQDPAEAAPNHNPEFFVHEEALVVGARAMASMAVSYLHQSEE